MILFKQLCDFWIGAENTFVWSMIFETMFHSHTTYYLRPQFLDQWMREEVFYLCSIVVSEDVLKQAQTLIAEAFLEFIASLTSIGIEEKSSSPNFEICWVCEVRKTSLHEFFDLFEKSIAAPMVETLSERGRFKHFKKALA